MYGNMMDYVGYRSGIAEWFQRNDFPTPPTNLRELATNLGVREIVPANLNVDAMLVPTFSGFTIYVNRLQNAARRKFSIAHEIGHMAIEPGYAVAYRHSKTHQAKERTCDYIASHILMPEPAFSNLARESGASLETVITLSSLFETSIQATARRLVEAASDPLVLLISKSAFSGNKGEFVVSWSDQKGAYTPEYPRYFIPRNKHVGCMDSISAAFQTRDVCSGYEAVNLGNLKGRLFVESCGFGSAANRFVASLVHVNNRKPRLL